jgi:signal transduction histidine kinase/ActR/RegA family two-component response regulator
MIPRSPSPAQLKPRESNRVSEFFRRYLVVCFVIVVCSTITILIYNSNIAAAHESHAVKSKRNSTTKHSELVDLLSEYEEALIFIRGFVQASNYVDRDEWRRFITTAQINEQYPGVQGFGYVQRVEPSDLQSFTEELKAFGHDDFQITAHDGFHQLNLDSPRYLIKYNEPESRNSAAIGLDVSLYPANKEVYDRATDTNTVQISSPIILKQQENTDSHIGLVLALPHYAQGMPLDTVSQRRYAIRGWVVISLDMQRFTQTAVNNEGMIDRVQMSTKNLNGDTVQLFNTHKQDPALICGKCNTTHYGIASTYSTNFGGRTFNTRITTSPFVVGAPHSISALHADLKKAHGNLLIGIKLTLLLAAITLFISNGRSRALALAQSVMDSLRKSENELRQFAYNAQQANKAKSEFLANMSHEIRTPMTAILGYTDILSEMTPHHQDPERMQQAVNRILGAGDHMLTVINEVLDLSKIESGKLEIRPAPCRVGEILAEIQNTMKDRADKSNLALNVEFRTPIPATIVTDSYRIRQIMLNLVGNAIKFTESGSVTIAVSATKSKINFAVHDTGIGVDQNRLEKLFVPYTQVESTDQDAPKGTGLGLSISRQLTEMMGGTLTATSKLGQGSIFSCAIPLHMPEDKADELIQELPCSKSTHTLDTSKSNNLLSGRVLVAEDGPDNQKLLEHYLTKAGLSVTLVENGKLAVEQIQQHNSFDLIIMDMQMPVLDGYQATATLRAQGYTLPILALTANAMSDDRQKCLAAGCNEYETKPISKARLLRTVERLLEPEQNKDQRAA